MRCPHCQTDTLTPVTLDVGPEAQQCSTCRGHWLRSDDLSQWKESAAELVGEAVEPAELPVVDSRKAKLCADCGRLLLRFKVHPDLDFRLDRCGGCGGIWFDEHEWKMLESRGLQQDLGEFFTQAWQQKMRRADIRQRLETQYRARFGEADYARLVEVREWLSDHPLRSELIAFLSSEDPFA